MVLLGCRRHRALHTVLPREMDQMHMAILTISDPPFTLFAPSILFPPVFSPSLLNHTAVCELAVSDTHHGFSPRSSTTAYPYSFALSCAPSVFI